MTPTRTPIRTPAPAESLTLRDRAAYWRACAAQAPTTTAAAACQAHARQHRTYCPSR